MWIDQRGSEVLQRSECLRLVALAARAGAVGRIGLSQNGGPLIQPVQFTYHERLVLLRLGEGSMLEDAPGHLVAFEVDSVDGPSGEAWSVLVRGLATRLPAGAELVRAAPRPAVPEPGSFVLAIRPDVVSGRRFHFSPSAPPADGAPRAGFVAVPETWAVSRHAEVAGR